MRLSERLVVGVTFDERRGGYVATVPGLATVTALSLSSLRKRVEAQLPPTETIKLELDRVARRERDRRRTGEHVLNALRRGRAFTAFSATPQRIALAGVWALVSDLLRQQLDDVRQDRDQWRDQAQIITRHEERTT